LLADAPDLAGSHDPRRRLRAKFLRLAERVAARLERTGDADALERLHLRVLDAEPDA
jgi:hypothetical protein